MKPPPPTVSDPRWDALRARIAERFGPVEESWAWSGAKHGWALRIARGKRPLVYLKPLEVGFRASLAIPVGAAVPPELAVRVEAAPVAAEGRAVRVEVASEADVATVVALVALRAGSGGSGQARAGTREGSFGSG